MDVEFVDTEEMAQPDPSPDEHQSAFDALEEGEGESDLDVDLQSRGLIKPDYQPYQVVRLPNLLAAAASGQLSAQMQQLLPGPLFSFLNNPWKSQEKSHIQIFMLRLRLCQQVLNRRSMPLWELFSGFEGSRHADLEIIIPERGYNLHERHEQLTAGSGEASLESISADRWAFLGPGKSGPDGWLILPIWGRSRQFFTLYFQSKKPSSQLPTLLTKASIEQERSKASQVPSRLGKASMLFVTDQEARGLPMAVVTRSGETIVVDCNRQQQYYSALLFIKAALLKASQPRGDWCGELNPTSHCYFMYPVAQKLRQRGKLLLLLQACCGYDSFQIPD